jgi:NADH dehydrogenase
VRIQASDVVTSALLVAGAATLYGEVRKFEDNHRRKERLTRADGGTPHRIVIVGVGFGGLAAANELGKRVGDDPAYDVLLIDRHNYHLFYPLLYQVATGGVEPGALAFPARTIARTHGFRFLEATVERVDPERNRLETDAGPIEFDCLILAPGSVTNFFGMADAQQHALPLKSLEDGMQLRNRVIDCFEVADREPEPACRRALLTFVVVGGGATGVELSASLSDLIFTALLPNYPGIRASEVRLILIEARGGVLPGWNPQLGAIASEHLQRQQVELMPNTTVSHVSESGVETGQGISIPTATVVWTAGVRAAPLAASLPGDHGRDGRIQVDEHLEVPGCSGIYVVGDAAAVIDPNTQRPYPPTAPVAIAAGQVAAANAIAQFSGQPRQVFQFRSKGDLVSLGRGSAAADIFGFIFDGMAGWLMRRAVYLVNLVGFRNRLSVVLDWAFVTFHQRVIASFGPEAGRALAPEIAALRESNQRQAEQRRAA